MPRSGQPIAFEPQFFERVWGGRRLAEIYGKTLPEGAVIGESWELSDRDDAQSLTADAPRTLHDLWTTERAGVFGARGLASQAPRFPLLIKLLDAQDTLSVQVHPPTVMADELGGEPKNEMWVIAPGTSKGSHIYAGLRAGVDRAGFERALTGGDDISAMLHRIEVEQGDSIFIPSGRVHAIGAGCVIVEIQQNSDTTYRVFDFNRPGLDGQPRDLHVEQSLCCIDFADQEPPLADGPIRTPFFECESWSLDGERVAAPDGECAVVIVLAGEVRCGDSCFAAGELFLVPAADPAPLRGVHADLLRVMLAQR